MLRSSNARVVGKDSKKPRVGLLRRFAQHPSPAIAAETVKLRDSISKRQNVEDGACNTLTIAARITEACVTTIAWPPSSMWTFI
jgi:hypothetical protein